MKIKVIDWSRQLIGSASCNSLSLISMATTLEGLTVKCHMLYKKMILKVNIFMYLVSSILYLSEL